MHSKRDIRDKLSTSDIEGCYVVYGVAACGAITARILGLQTSWVYNKWNLLRAYRHFRYPKKTKFAEVPDNHLADELLVAFGPELSAKDAVAALERLIADIKHAGLLIGRGPRREDVYYQEEIDGTVTEN
jgi:hypothetical protein